MTKKTFEVKFDEGMDKGFLYGNPTSSLLVVAECLTAAAWVGLSTVNERRAAAVLEIQACRYTSEVEKESRVKALQPLALADITSVVVRDTVVVS